MTGYQVYMMYLALRNHFNSDSYDYFKYNKKVNALETTFRRRRDRWHFEKIARKYEGESENFLIANLLEDPQFWVGNAMKPASHDVYTNWVKRYEGIEYTLKQDLLKIFEVVESNENLTFLRVLQVPNDNRHSVLIKMLIREEITLETFTILMNNYGLDEIYNCKYSSDPMWKKIRNKAMKYLPFVLQQKSEEGFQTYIQDVLRSV